MIRDGSGIPSPPRPPGPCRRSARARAGSRRRPRPRSRRRRRRGGRAPPGRRAGRARSPRAARRLGQQPLGAVELSDLVQPRGLADQLALAAPEADLDRERERVGGDGVRVDARAGDVLLEPVEQRLAAQKRCPAPRRERARRRSSSASPGSAAGERPPLRGGELIEQLLEGSRGRLGPAPFRAPRSSTLVPKPFSASSSSIAASPSPAGRHSSASPGLRRVTSISASGVAEQLGAPAPHQLGVVDELPELGRRLDQGSLRVSHLASFRPSNPESCEVLVNQASAGTS